MEKLLLKPMEAAELIGVGRSTMYSMLAEGIIPSIRISPRLIRIPTRVLNEWVKDQGNGTDESES